MSVLVTDKGFSICKESVEAISADSAIEEIDFSKPQLAIEVSSFADGRAFGLASALRRRGYKGRLRAKGYVLADQYAMARRVGFDEVEISDELAKRQDESQWLARANWQAYNYQTRLGRDYGASEL